MVKEKQAMSRYSHPCPACGAIIRPSDIHGYGDSFPCPSCGEWLKYDNRNSLAICGVSLLAAAFVAWHILGYRDAKFIFATIGATILLCAVGVFLEQLLFPSALRRVQGKAFDKTPSLFVKDNPGTGKKTNL
jgi:hypothetical protein